MVIQKLLLLLMLCMLVLLGPDAALGQTEPATVWNLLNTQALEESSTPIRRGVPGQSPFWNVNATRFIYAPAFDFLTMQGAASYRFTATHLPSGKNSTFDAPNPWAPLSPLWKELPVGQILLKVEALDSDGKFLALTGVKKFYRAATYAGPYHEPVLDYRESARRALGYLFQLDPYQQWLTSNEPDYTYGYYRYPSKIIGAVVKGMAMYAQLSPENSEKALLIAEKAANHLLHISEPAGAPLEFFPPTYKVSDVKIGKTGKPADGYSRKYADQIMMFMPAIAGEVYLDLYDATNNTVYFDAAKRIAETYLKLQLPSGSWYLKMQQKTGAPITENVCIPIRIIDFLDRLEKQYGLQQYHVPSRRAFSWIIENPLKTYNWEGQFEDVAPSKPYVNLSRAQAALIAGYLLDHAEEDREYVALAEELLGFCEDQFVVWGQQGLQLNRRKKNLSRADHWITPCVLEQYHFYVPIGASAAKMIEGWQKAYAVTGKELYLAKARTLANTMTVAQNPNGRYPTQWRRKKNDQYFWFNCATYDAKTMIDFADFLDARQQQEATE